MTGDRRPIKVVLASDGDLHAPRGGGGIKVFPTDEGFIDKLDAQIVGVSNFFGEALKQPDPLPAVARVKLRSDAVAKSHSPTALFNDTTCQIIGTEGVGDLLVSVSRAGLTRLQKAIRGTSKVMQAAVSTVRTIEPYQVIGAASLKKGESGKTLKVRLFTHRDDAIDERILAAFRSLARSLTQREPVALRYAPGLSLFKIAVGNNEIVKALSGFVGIQDVSEMPTYAVEVQAVDHGPATPQSLPAPEDGVEYPVVGLLDSGTDRLNADLQRWVVDRDEVDVPRCDQDTRHGSFIAGLLINAAGLNHGDPRFPSGPCKILDAVVFPKAGGAPHPEDVLVSSIRRVIEKHHAHVKVWNLSISSVRAVCCNERFSDFAIALDDIQDRFDVTIVTCTGNVKDNWRPWPRTGSDLGELDRMFPAGDSVRAITVSSVAHEHRANSLAQRGHPSPFSRRGPGPAFLPKPELSHYGGNCDGTGAFTQTGILSVDNMGRITERVGTSYAAPLVAIGLANLRHRLNAPIPRCLGKALMIHSAVLGRELISAEELRYCGFGVPGNVTKLLECEPWQATLIFEPEFQPGLTRFSKLHFPIPPSMRDEQGRVSGEFVVTLVYDPPTDPRANAGYCRVNIDASVGTYARDKSGKRKHAKQVDLVPHDADTLLESEQLEHGFKWSPVKVYRSRVRNVASDLWRIALRLFYRTPEEACQPQKIALIVTFQDPTQGNLQVYNETVRQMNLNGWITQDLQVRTQSRAASRG